MTPLKQEQLDLLVRSNQTFAVVGRFGKGQAVALFSNLPEDANVRHGRLTVHDFFKIVEPGLIAGYGQLHRYGDFVLNAYMLKTALEAGNGVGENGAWQAIGATSELLQASSLLARITRPDDTLDEQYFEIQKI